LPALWVKKFLGWGSGGSLKKRKVAGEKKLAVKKKTITKKSREKCP